MTQPTRWLDNHDTSAEIRELLRAGARPPRFPRVALAATVIPFVQKAALANASVISSTAVLAMKAASLGLAIGLGSLAAVKTLSGPESTAPQSVRTADRPPNVASTTAARSVETTPGVEHPLSPASLADDAPAVTAPMPAMNPAAATGIAAEAQLLERARSLLDESPARALLLTNEHRERFNPGQMTAERELIAIDALLRLGRQNEADRRAQPLLADGAGQVFAQRLRNLLERHAR